MTRYLSRLIASARFSWHYARAYLQWCKLQTQDSSERSALTRGRSLDDFDRLWTRYRTNLAARGIGTDRSIVTLQYLLDRCPEEVMRQPASTCLFRARGEGWLDEHYRPT